MIWLNIFSFWILERRFGSCSILQISLRTGNFYYLTGSRQPLVKFGAVAGDPKATIWSFHLTLTIVFVLFLKHFQVKFGWNWVKGILSRFWFGNISLIDLNFGRIMKIVILRKTHYLQWGHPYFCQIPSFRPLLQIFKIFYYSVRYHFCIDFTLWWLCIL